jgi:hypothetical protein
VLSWLAKNISSDGSNESLSTRLDVMATASPFGYPGSAIRKDHDYLPHEKSESRRRYVGYSRLGSVEGVEGRKLRSNSQPFQFPKTQAGRSTMYKMPTLLRCSSPKWAKIPIPPFGATICPKVHEVRS